MSIRILGALGLLASRAGLRRHAHQQTRPLAADGQVRIENIKGRIVVRTWAQAAGADHRQPRQGRREAARSAATRARSTSRSSTRTARGGWNLWGRDDNRTEPTILEVMHAATRLARRRLGQRRRRRAADGRAQARRVQRQRRRRRHGVLARRGQLRERQRRHRPCASPRNKLDAESVSGDMRAAGRPDRRGRAWRACRATSSCGAQALDRLEVSTVSGDAHLRAALRPDGSDQGRDAERRAAADHAARHRRRAARRDLQRRHQRARPARSREEHGPGKSLDTSFGDGRGRIDLESFSGDVRIALRLSARGARSGVASSSAIAPGSRRRCA